RERRQIEAKLRAEYERQLEVELAKRSPVSDPAATSSEQPEPVGESVKQPRASTAQIRAWATEQGLEAPARGSLPSDVVDAYHKAHAEEGGALPHAGPPVEPCPRPLSDRNCPQRPGRPGGAAYPCRGGRCPRPTAHSVGAGDGALPGGPAAGPGRADPAGVLRSGRGCAARW